MQTGLVAERGVTDVGRYGRRRLVAQLRDGVADLGEPLESLGRDQWKAALELEVTEHGEQVRVPAALADAVRGALHLARPDLETQQRVRDRAATVVMEVQPDVSAQRLRTDRADHLGDDLGDVPRHRTTVRVAQHDGLRAGLGRSDDDLPGVVTVAGPTVEEVLRVEHDATALRAQVTDRVGDHRDVLRA